MSQELAGALIGLGGAVLGLIGGALVTLSTHRAQELRENAASFREVLEKLILARMEHTRIWVDFSGPEQVHIKETLSGALNARRLLLKSTAAQMIERVNDDLLADDFLTLGFEHQSDGDFEKARDYYDRALQLVGDDVMARINTHRNLAAVYLSNTRLHDLEAAEEHFETAVELSRNRRDEYAKYTTGYTLEQWGWALISADRQGGHDRIRQAVEAYESMSPANLLRASALAALEHRRAQSEAGRRQPIPPTDAAGGGPASQPPTDGRDQLDAQSAAGVE